MFDLTYYLNGKLNVAVHTLVRVCAVSSFAMLIYTQTTSCTLPSWADSDISIGVVDLVGKRIARFGETVPE